MKSIGVLFAGAAIAAPLAALAQDVTVVEGVLIAGSPLSAADVPAGQAPYASEQLSADDLSRTGSPSLLRALAESSGQIQVNHAQANPFQPNVSYRGFEASPLVGNAQGLAVYIDGARFNQAFGDTVNWDLVPDFAIGSVTVEGANPVFGLNALGGSLDLRLKSGADVDGFAGETAAGSFGRVDLIGEYGLTFDGGALYIGARALEDDGWRDFSPSELRQLYAGLDFSDRRGGESRIQLLAADNALTGNGTSPVELLAIDREAIFTYPDNTRNELQRLSFSTDRPLSSAWSWQGLAYVQNFDQETENGDAADVEACDAPFEGFLCEEDEGDEPLEDENGDEIADFLGGEDYAFFNRGATNSDSYGLTLQTRGAVGAGGLTHRVLAGVSLDAGSSTFGAGSELGALGEDRGYVGPGVIVESDEIGSIGVRTHNRYYGLYFSDRVNLTDAITLTLSGRYNAADVVLRDLIGTELNGEHSFSRFNPAVGLAWKPNESMTVFGGYSEANRAPSPAELSCADPDAPCSLTNFFVGDPPLEQVVARTFETGVRFADGPLSWSVTGYSTETEDDIMFIAAESIGRAFFQNVGETRRQGLQGDVAYDTGRLTASLSLAWTDATFETPLILNAPDNPFADADGRIAVMPGDRLPGVARYKAKAAAGYQITDRWSADVAVVHQAGQYLFGDESNDNPRTDDFTLVNLATRFDVTERVQLFGSVENLFDTKYETFGTFSPVDEVPIDEIPGGVATNPRALSPGAPFSAYIGLRFRL
jgi:iron complex outermembrane receptor protein